MSALLGLWGRESGNVVSEQFISALAEHGALDAKNKDGFQPILSQITNSLSSGTTRSKGLHILKSLFKAKVITDDVLISHGQTWLPLCVKTLKPLAVSPYEKSLALLVIREILDASSKIHELERNVVSSSLSDLVDALVKCKPEIHGSVLSCLYTLLLCHSKSSGAYKIQIEKFLIQFLDSDNKEHVKLAAKCTHLLQQVRGGGEQGVNHKLAWKNQFDQCTKSCHIILKELFKISQSNYQDISFFEQNNFELQDNQPTSKAPLRPFEIVYNNISSENKLYSFVSKESEEVEDNEEDNASKSIIVKVNTLMTRLENMLVFIQALLVEPYPVAKQIKCIPLFEVLLSCLALKSKITNQEVTLDSMAVILRAPNLRSIVMRTIKALIVCINKDIIPYSFLILKMVIQVLDESKLENDTGKIKAYKNTRIMAYDTLSFLLLTVHSLRPPPKEGDTGFEDQLVANFISDIISHKMSMQLTVKKVGPLKQMSKKARRKLAMSQLDSSNLPQNFGNSNSSNADLDSNETNNVDLILAALSCLEAFFKSCGVFLKKNTHKIIQETLVKQIYNGSSNFAINQALSKALLSVQYFQSQLQPMPLPYCLDIFSRNQHSLDLNTAISSKTALSNCTGLIHGIAPPLNFCHERISNDNEHQNANSDSHNISESVDIIDVDNYSMYVDRSTQSTESHNNDKIFPNFGKRKGDNDFQNTPKFPKNSDKNDSVTMLIDIADSSDSEGSMKVKDYHQTNVSTKSANDKSFPEESINLVNTLSDDDNNDVVYMEMNDILVEGVEIGMPNNNLNDTTLQDCTILTSSNDFASSNENLTAPTFSASQESENSNPLTIVEEPDAATLPQEDAINAEDKTKQNADTIDPNVVVQVENINCEVDINVEAMMNALVDEVQEEFE